MIISQRFVNIIYLFKNLEVLCIYEFHPTPINSCNYLNNIVCHDGNDIKEDLDYNWFSFDVDMQMQLNHKLI
jgi:hypothetical protein